MDQKQKVIVVLGQTATGKSALAVHLAKKYNGEIISADSRQVYTGLDIGTAKITKRDMQGVPHHLLDVLSPKRTMTAATFKKKGQRAIQAIIKKGMLPIIAGGTGFYIDALLGTVALPEVTPNPTLRKQLEKKSTAQLYSLLKKRNPLRAKTIDPHNPRRIIRALEIAHAGVHTCAPTDSPYSALKIGLELPADTLRFRIATRLAQRMRAGMVAEVKRLHSEGLSYRRMEELGLEYRYLARYLEEKISKEELLKTLETEIWRYAKRQATWFRRDKTIQWFAPTDVKKIEGAVKEFIAR